MKNKQITYAFFKLAISVHRISTWLVLINCLTIFSFFLMGVFIEYKMLNHENCVENDWGDWEDKLDSIEGAWLEEWLFVCDWVKRLLDETQRASCKV